MTLRALVTRPEDDAAPLAAALAERGIEVTAEPLLTIKPVPDAPIDLAGVQALLFTSANGVRAFAGLSGRRELPALAVGDATAAAAREAGFLQVESASGDVTALARLVAARLDPAAGALFHAAGSAVAGDLAGLLGQAGFTLRREMLYEAQPADRLSAATAAKLAAGELDLVLFFSPRTATAFVTLIRAAGESVIQGCTRATALCLSPAVATVAGELAWRDIRTAARPELPALLDLIDAELAAQARGGDTGEPQPQPAAAAINLKPQADQLQRRSRLVPILVTAAVTAVVIVLGAELLRSWWSKSSSTQTAASAPDAATIERLDGVEERLRSLEAEVASLQEKMSGVTAQADDIGKRIEALLTAPDRAEMMTRLDGLEQEVATLRAGELQPARTALPAEFSALTERIAAIEAHLAAPPAAASAAGPNVAAAALEKLAAENAGLRDQMAALAAQLESLKGVGGRLDALDQAIAAHPGDGGATLVLAVSNLGAAAAAGRPFVTELGAVVQIAAPDAALAAKVNELTAPIASYAATGIPTLVDLRARFDRTARAIVDVEKDAASAPADSAPKEWYDRPLDWLSSAADAVLSDVSIRPVGEVEGDGPGPRVARAELRLAEGALAAAVAELEALSGAPAEAAAAWLADARARLAADVGMAELQAAVLAKATGGTPGTGG